MKLEAEREVDPYNSFDAHVVIDPADWERVFGGENPDEELYWKLFGPDWHELKISEQLMLLHHIAVVLEGQATQLNLTAAPPVLKGE